MLTEEELEAAIERGAREMSAHQTGEYAAQPPVDQDLAERHAVLLGYYRYGPCPSVEKVVFHLTRLISLQPEARCLSRGWVSRKTHPTHHAKVAILWRRLADRGSSGRVLLNAFHFFEFEDEEYAGLLLKRGLAASQSDRIWHLAAGGYYLRRGIRGDRTQRALAHAHYAEALSLSDGEMQQNVALGLVAYSAFKAGKSEEARQAASEAISRGGFHDGVNQHLGYTVLGLLAYECGDLERAAEHLAASARNVPEYYLNAFGPRLDLAQRLLEADRRAPVEAFVAELVARWPGGSGRLQALREC